MPPSSLIIGLIQQINNEDREANWRSSEKGIRQAAAQGAKLIILPELHSSLYFCQTENPDYFQLAEPLPGPTTEHFAKIAQELAVTLVTSIFQRRAVGIYHNTAVVIDPQGKISGSYQKMHIPDDPGFYEKYYFSPGDQGFIPIQSNNLCLGVQVCWDQWFPEGARLMTLAGADLLIYPAAIGWEKQESCDQLKQKELNAWIAIQQSHAIANGIPVICCNRSGVETTEDGGGIEFWGNSFVVAADGGIIARSPTDTADVLVCTVDLEQTRTQRHTWPFLRDRRIDQYQGLNQRYL